MENIYMLWNYIMLEDEGFFMLLLPTMKVLQQLTGIKFAWWKPMDLPTNPTDPSPRAKYRLDNGGHHHVTQFLLRARVAGVMSRVRPSPNFRPRHKNANKLRLAATVMKLRHEIDTQISSRNCARVVQNQAEVAWVEETAQSLGHTM